MNSPDSWQQLLDALETVWPKERFRNVGIVVGCSGGGDSVALLHALHQQMRGDSEPRSDLKNSQDSSGFIVVAHFNHRLRDADSDDDARFVHSLAEQLGLRCETACGSGTHRDEQTLRTERRRFFGDVARKSGARYIALGHSLDDNVETVMQRLFRGTGPSGLVGIHPFRPLSDDDWGCDIVVARPLLKLRRDAIRRALRERELPWREDVSNQSNDYRRNWIRNELLPLVQTQFPDPVEAVARAIEAQGQWAECVNADVERWLSANLLARQPLRIRRIDPANRASANAQREPNQGIVIEALKRCWLTNGWPLQAFTMAHWTRVYDLLAGHTVECPMLPGAVSVRIESDHVTFSRATDSRLH